MNKIIELPFVLPFFLLQSSEEHRPQWCSCRSIAEQLCAKDLLKVPPYTL